MELPNVGEQCSHCQQLDYLPAKCPGCQQIFCRDCLPHAKHECPNAHLVDAQVPVCPLCGVAVPCRPGGDLNLTMTRHIDGGCKPPKVEKAFVHGCMKPGCKSKELLPVICNDCGTNFCFKHRFPADHGCRGRSGARSGSNSGGGTAARAGAPDTSGDAALAQRLAGQSSSSPGAEASSAQPPTSTAQLQQQQQQQQQQQSRREMDAAREARRQQWEQGVAGLMAIGYPRSIAISALEISGGDVNAAAIALSEQPPTPQSAEKGGASCVVS